MMGVSLTVDEGRFLTFEHGTVCLTCVGYRPHKVEICSQTERSNSAAFASNQKRREKRKEKESHEAHIDSKMFHITW